MRNRLRLGTRSIVSQGPAGNASPMTEANPFPPFALARRLVRWHNHRYSLTRAPSFGACTMTRINRRQFTKGAAAAGISTALSASRVYGANERIRLGFIGLGNRGDQVLDGFLEQKDCEVVGVCDIHEPYSLSLPRRAAAAPIDTRTITRCSPARMWTPSSSSRPITGMHCR